MVVTSIRSRLHSFAQLVLEKKPLKAIVEFQRVTYYIDSRKFERTVEEKNNNRLEYLINFFRVILSTDPQKTKRVLDADMFSKYVLCFLDGGFSPAPYFRISMAKSANELKDKMMAYLERARTPEALASKLLKLGGDAQKLMRILLNDATNRIYSPLKAYSGDPHSFFSGIRNGKCSDSIDQTKASMQRKYQIEKARRVPSRIVFGQALEMAKSFLSGPHEERVVDCAFRGIALEFSYLDLITAVANGVEFDLLCDNLVKIRLRARSKTIHLHELILVAAIFNNSSVLFGFSRFLADYYHNNKSKILHCLFCWKFDAVIVDQFLSCFATRSFCKCHGFLFASMSVKTIKHRDGDVDIGKELRNGVTKAHMARVMRKLCAQNMFQKTSDGAIALLAGVKYRRYGLSKQYFVKLAIKGKHIFRLFPSRSLNALTNLQRSVLSSLGRIRELPNGAVVIVVSHKKF